MLFIINSMRPGGTENVAVTIINHFAIKKNSVTLCILNDADATLLKNLSPKVRLVNLNVKRTRGAALSLFELVSRDQPEKILVFNYEILLLLSLIRIFFKNKPLIFFRPPTILKRKVHTSITRFLYGLAFDRTEKIIAQSICMKNGFNKIYKGRYDRQLTVINNPIKTIEKHGNTERIEFGPYALCVSRLNKLKNVEEIILAYDAHVKRSLLCDLKLLIVGDGPEKKTLQTLIRNLDLESRVILSGHSENLYEIYDNAKFCVLYSHAEGFPNTLVESISFGTPVLAHDCECGPREIIIEGVNGHLVPYKDFDAFVSGFEKMTKTDWNTKQIIQTSSKYQKNYILSKYNAFFLD